VIDKPAYDVLWKAAQEHWPEITRDETYLTFTEMPLVEALVPKVVFPNEKISWAGACLRVAQVTGVDTGLTLNEQLELMRQSSDFEMECIALKPIGDFVMGYGPRADLLAVQEIR